MLFEHLLYDWRSSRFDNQFHVDRRTARLKHTSRTDGGMSTFDLGLLPSGHLHCFPSIADDTTDDAMQFVAIGEAFALCIR